MTDPNEIWDNPHDPIEPLEQAARVTDISDRLSNCLDELDRLALWDVGAHLSMAITLLDRHAPPAPPSIV